MGFLKDFVDVKQLVDVDINPTFKFNSKIVPFRLPIKHFAQHVNVLYKYSEQFILLIFC